MFSAFADSRERQNLGSVRPIVPVSQQKVDFRVKVNCSIELDMLIHLSSRAIRISLALMYNSDVASALT